MPTILRRLSVALRASLLVAAGCGGGPATVNGSVKGRSLAAGDAVSAVIALSSTTSALAVDITSASGICTLLRTHVTPAGSQQLSLNLVNNASGNPLTVGTFTVAAGTSSSTMLAATASYLATDAMCNATVSATAMSGTVTVSSASTGGASGSFDLTFDSGDHLTGSFHASNCDDLATASGANNCM